MKRMINFVKGRREDKRDQKFINSPICVEITNPAGQKIQTEDEHILGLQSGYGYQIDINGKDKNMSKFHKAAWQGNLDKVKVHLKKADVNSVDHFNRTALHFAVAQGHSNVAFYLLGAKALFDFKDSDGMTPFLKAVECGNKECVNLLLEKGADAVECGNKECVNLLLEKGADVSVVDRNGNTGLHLASKLGFLNISSLLLMKGANINISNNVGEFPLHLATEGEHREVVALLLSSGAQINVIDRDNRTPLMLAARFGINSLVSLFLEHGASLEACDSNGWTAEDYALIGGHQQLAIDLKAPAREQVCKEMEEAVVNGSSSDETKEEENANDWGKDVFSDESEANQPTVFVETAEVQINAELVESDNGNNESHDRTIGEEDGIGLEHEDRKEEGETVESPRSCVTPPPLRPPRSWDLIQAGMIDEKEVQRRSLTTLGTLRSRRESFNENSNNNINNGGSSPNQGRDDLETITDIVKTVQMEGLVDDESSEEEQNLPLDRATSVRRSKAAPLERTPSLDLTLTEEDLSKSKGSQGCAASSNAGTLGREDTLQGYEEIWEKNANISEAVDNVGLENNNKQQQSTEVDHEFNQVLDTGQLTTDISEQLVQRNREINTTIGYVTNEIYRIMIEKNEPQTNNDKVINQTVHASSSLDNLDERKPKFTDMESSRSCDNLDNRYMTLEEKLCSGIYSAETLDSEPSINENEGTQSLDNLDESPVGTVIKRNMHREVQSLDTLDDYDQCCNHGCVEARQIKKHSRNKSVSVGQHGWSKSVDVLSKPSNIDRIQIDTKKIDAQLECYDEALRELAQVEMLKRNSSSLSSAESSLSFDRKSSKSDNQKKHCFPINRDIPYLSEVVSNSSQKSREYFMKPKDEGDFSINQDSSPLPKRFDKSGSVDGLLDSDRTSSADNTTINESFRSEVRLNSENDCVLNLELPPPPPVATASNFHNETFETDVYCNLEKLGCLENENVINGNLNGAFFKQKNDDGENEDSESKRAREVENNLYKLEKDLFNINMSTIMKPLRPEVNQNGVIHQDVVVANGEMASFDIRNKFSEKGVKQTSFAVLDESRRVLKDDSLSPVDRSGGEESPRVPPRNKRSLRKGKSESEVCSLLDVKSYKNRSKSASMYTEVESLLERPSKGVRKKSNGSGDAQEKSESDSELCERPLRRKRKMLLAMRGVVAGSKDSEDDDDTSTGDPPFWLSTDKGGHFARQDTVMAAQPNRIPAKPQDPPGFVKAGQSDEKGPDLDKDWTSSDADTASGSDEVIVGSAYSLGSHHKLLKEHLRQATNEKTVLEEAVAVLKEQEERLQYELADARQALAAREDTVAILQEQARRMETRYSNILDEAQTLRHLVSSSDIELKHLRELCDKLAMEKADLADELNQLRNTEHSGQSVISHLEKKTPNELKPEQMQLLQRQKLEAERRNEILVNHLEEAMRQSENAKSEKEALALQNITDIKKLQQDTLLWKERYEDCLARLERMESECQPRLMDAQRTINMLQTSIKQLEAEKHLDQDCWKTKVMDEPKSRIKKLKKDFTIAPSALNKKSVFVENVLKQNQTMKNFDDKNKKSVSTRNDFTPCDNSGKPTCRKKALSSNICDATQNKVYNVHNFQGKHEHSKGNPNSLDEEYLTRLSLILEHNRKLLESLIDAYREKESIKNELCEIRKSIECDSQRPVSVDHSSPDSADKLNSERDFLKNRIEINESDDLKNGEIHSCSSKVRYILSQEETEIEGIIVAIQDVGTDLGNVMNSLNLQMILMKNFIENKKKYFCSVGEWKSFNYRNSNDSHASSEDKLFNGGHGNKFLMEEIVNIKKHIARLRSENKNICKLLNMLFEMKFEKKDEILSDELKNTIKCVKVCNNKILKVNSEILNLQKIIHTKVTKLPKDVCECFSDYPEGYINQDHTVPLEKNKFSSFNISDRSSRTVDMFSNNFGMQFSVSDSIKNADNLPFYQKSTKLIEDRSVLMSESLTTPSYKSAKVIESCQKLVDRDHSVLDNKEEKLLNTTKLEDENDSLILDKRFDNYNNEFFISKENFDNTKQFKVGDSGTWKNTQKVALDVSSNNQSGFINQPDSYSIVNSNSSSVFETPSSGPGSSKSSGLKFESLKKSTGIYRKNEYDLNQSSFPNKKHDGIVNNSNKLISSAKNDKILVDGNLFVDSSSKNKEGFSQKVEREKLSKKIVQNNEQSTNSDACIAPSKKTQTSIEDRNEPGMKVVISREKKNDSIFYTTKKGFDCSDQSMKVIIKSSESSSIEIVFCNNVMTKKSSACLSELEIHESQFQLYKESTDSVVIDDENSAEAPSDQLTEPYTVSSAQTEQPTLQTKSNPVFSSTIDDDVTGKLITYAESISNDLKSGGKNRNNIEQEIENSLESNNVSYDNRMIEVAEMENSYFGKSYESSREQIVLDLEQESFTCTTSFVNPPYEKSSLLLGGCIVEKQKCNPGEEISSELSKKQSLNEMFESCVPSDNFHVINDNSVGNVELIHCSKQVELQNEKLIEKDVRRKTVGFNEDELDSKKATLEYDVGSECTISTGDQIDDEIEFVEILQPPLSHEAFSLFNDSETNSSTKLSFMTNPNSSIAYQETELSNSQHTLLNVQLKDDVNSTNNSCDLNVNNSRICEKDCERIPTFLPIFSSDKSNKNVNWQSFILSGVGILKENETLPLFCDVGKSENTKDIDFRSGISQCSEIGIEEPQQISNKTKNQIKSHMNIQSTCDSQDQEINSIIQNLNLLSRSSANRGFCRKSLPVEEFSFKNNLSVEYCLADPESSLKLNYLKRNIYKNKYLIRQRRTEDLLDIASTDCSFVSNTFFSSCEENLLSQLQGLVNLTSLGCKADSSKDMITDIDKRLSAAQSSVDFTLQAQAAASASRLNQNADAISLDFQQVENLECPDSYDTTNMCIVNDVHKTKNGLQDSAPTVQKNSLSRERQEMAVGRIRQQALLESENNLSAKIAEINTVLHQQLEEQDRRREHNEMQMKNEFELTRQKLLMELSKVQTALKAKEAEERALREKYEKLSRDVEKTAEIKRKQLIEKSYSLNLAQPSTMWEKELSIKQSVVQSSLPLPPPPPPLPDLPCPLPADDRFSHQSLRAQLRQSVTKHRTNPRNSSDQVNLTASTSQFEDIANGPNNGTNAGASTSSNIKR